MPKSQSVTDDALSPADSPSEGGARENDSRRPPSAAPTGLSKKAAGAQAAHDSPVLPVLPLATDAPPSPDETPRAQAPSDAADLPELLTAGRRGRRRWSRWTVPRRHSFLVSAVLHATVMLVMAMIVQKVDVEGPIGSLTASLTAREELEFETEQLEWEPQPSVRPQSSVGSSPSDKLAEMLDVILSQTDLMGSGPASTNVGLETLSPLDLTRPWDDVRGGGFRGRNAEYRRSQIGRGPTAQSEMAVERGLRWLVAHQLEDGAWDFDHTKGSCQGLCRNPGTVTTTTGATALALAAFLGAGYTHQEGEYQQTIRRGLYYLSTRALVTPQGVDLQEGTMYAQGLAALVLSESYALTGDPTQGGLAQQAIHFIEHAQHPAGGWRYYPGTPGDTTVTGWQLMALKSGQLAGLKVSSPCMYLVNDFLDDVQSEYGAKYGYMDTTPRPTTTAVGLLCRMYLGWSRQHDALAAGVDYLAELGPSEQDMYFNYYTAQVLRHWGGAEWEDWHPAMRNYLVATQATGGHEAGSWHFPGKHAEQGGRLYNTAMAVMILEVYYRYMPLYGEQSFKD